MIGFRPGTLPPLKRDCYGIPIGHIQSGHWAERAGLKVGDVITHVNGRSVMDMQSGDEFIKAVSNRPLRLTIQIAVSASEMSEVLQAFDWSSRFQEVEKARKNSGDPKETNEMFDRVFSDAPRNEDKSSLFDFSKWMGSNSKPAPNVVLVEKPAVPQMPIESPIPAKQATPPPELPKVEPTVKPIVERKVQRRFPTTRTILKWVTTEPLCVWFKIDRGFDLPTKAGTLSMDYYFQPFSAEPFLELSLVTAPGREVNINEILDSKPVGARAIVQTPICDYNSRWDYTGSLSLSNNAYNEGDLMLVGKLLDYRRLEAARPMGVFAIKLDAIDILDDLAKAKPTLIHLTLIDAYTFDVSKTKIRMSVCLRGRQVAHSENVRSPVPSPKASTASSPSLISSPVDSSVSSRVPSPPPEPEPPLIKTTIAAAPLQYRTPFQRAYSKALADIKKGDNSPIHYQHYTLR